MFIGAAVAVTLTGCSVLPSAESEELRPGVEVTALSADCREAPWPMTVEELDEAAISYTGHPGFAGGDGAMEALLSDGRRLVLFGDTLRAEDYPGGAFVRNSMMLVEPGEACMLTGPNGKEVIPDRSDGIGYWPMSIIVTSRGDRDDVAIMAQRVAASPSDDLGFIVLGTSLVRLHIPVGGVPVLRGTVDFGRDDPSRERITWGAAMWPGDDGWVQIFGTSNPEGTGVFGWALHAARARAADLADPSRWQYWDGTRWSDQSGAAATIIPADGGVAQVLSVFERDGRWFAVSTLDGDLGDSVVVWEAPAATGPYTANAASLELVADESAGELKYLVIAHPDLFEQPGSVVISYSQGSTDLDELVTDPLNYRPRFVRIALPD